MIILKLLGITVTLLSLLTAPGESIDAKGSMRERLRRLRESTVRILVNGRPAGTGFAVAGNLVATNFHVVQHLSPAAGGQTQVEYAGAIQIQLHDGRLLSAAPHPSVTENNLSFAVGRDVTLLTVTANDLKPLKLGRFADAAEGDPLYLAGYPFNVEQVVVATGILSTKWKASGYLSQGGTRDVAWLDMTMNKGNSGGPVLSLADDAVVCIANFSLNPFAQSAEDFANIAAKFPGQAVVLGIDFKKFSSLIGAALSSQSHGVGGCVAVDYVQLPKP